MATLPWLWVLSSPVVLSFAELALVPVLQEVWLGQSQRRIGFVVRIPDMLFGLWLAVNALNGKFHGARQEFAWNVTGLAIR